MILITDYTIKHNNVGKIPYMALVQKYKLEFPQPYYQYTTEPVTEIATHKIYRDSRILTDKTIIANRSGITQIDRKHKMKYITDLALPSDHNTKVKYNEKIDKYMLLVQELKLIWKDEKVIITPFIISFRGTTRNIFSPSL